jgi:hypothetical protein
LAPAFRAFWILGKFPIDLCGSADVRGTKIKKVDGCCSGSCMRPNIQHDLMEEK